MKPRTFLGLILLLALALLFAGSAQAGQCESIRFKRGASSGTVTGMAPPDDVVCYQMSTGAGQRANITIKGTNCMFSIEGVVEAQDRYNFTTEKKTYKINVGQLMRAIDPEPFTLSVSVR